jgi:hypothetical protein
MLYRLIMQGRIQEIKLGGAHLKKLRRAEGGAKIFGVFRVKNYDFTPKNHIFSNCGERREYFWGNSTGFYHITFRIIIMSCKLKLFCTETNILTLTTSFFKVSYIQN